MTFEPNPYDPSSQPASTDSKPRGFGRIPRAALIGGLSFGLVLGGTGIGFAAASSSSSSSSPSTSVPTFGMHGKGRMHDFGRFFAPGMGHFKFGGNVVHGQATIHTSSGYKTMYFQVGAASAISSTSITVTSTDGFKQVYAVDPSTVVDAQRDGISSVAANDQVRILATKSGSAETAVNIIDVTKLQSSGTHFGMGWGKGDAPDGPSTPSGAGTSGYPGFPPGPAGGTQTGGELN